MSEIESNPFFTDEELKHIGVDRILFDSLSPEIVIASQVNENNIVNLQARYTGAAVEALSIDGTQDGIDLVVDFFTNAASVSFSKTGMADKPLLLTAHDIAVRYKSDRIRSQKLLEHELNVCWPTHASETSNTLLNRRLTDEQIIRMVDKLTCNQDVKTSGSIQHLQFLDIAKFNSSRKETFQVIDRAFARHKIVNPTPSQIFIHH